MNNMMRIKLQVLKYYPSFYFEGGFHSVFHSVSLMKLGILHFFSHWLGIWVQTEMVALLLTLLFPQYCPSHFCGVILLVHNVHSPTNY